MILMPLHDKLCPSTLKAIIPKSKCVFCQLIDKVRLEERKAQFPDPFGGK